jgi:hypothetical protein
MSPLLANVALSMLDEHIAHAPGGHQRAKRRRNGLPNYRLVRYADDWVLAVSGTRAHAEALREEIAEVLSTMGLRLSPDKNTDHPHRRGPRLSRLAHPASPQARHQPALRLHLPHQEGPAGRDGHGADVVSTGRHEQSARCPAASAQPGAAGLVRLLPAGRVGSNLRLPRPLRVVAGRTVAATQTRPDHLEGTAPPPLRQWMVASQPGTATVQPRDSARHALPIPGSSHPVPWQASA